MRLYTFVVNAKQMLTCRVYIGSGSGIGCNCKGARCFQPPKIKENGTKKHVNGKNVEAKGRLSLRGICHLNSISRYNCVYGWTLPVSFTMINHTILDTEYPINECNI